MFVACWMYMVWYGTGTGYKVYTCHQKASIYSK